LLFRNSSSKLNIWIKKLVLCFLKFPSYFKHNLVWAVVFSLFKDTISEHKRKCLNREWQVQVPENFKRFRDWLEPFRLDLTELQVMQGQRRRAVKQIFETKLLNFDLKLIFIIWNDN
jgi:hypothetical protein